MLPGSRITCLFITPRYGGHPMAANHTSNLFSIQFIIIQIYNMKKFFLLATTAMLMTGAVAIANGGPKEAKKDSKKARTEKACPKGCCGNDKCEKGSKCDKCVKS